MKRRILFCAAAVAVGCSSVPPPEPASEVASSRDADVAPGMTIEQVEARWGDTDCFFSVELDGRRYLAAGYGLDARTGEVRGVAGCDATRLALYFEGGRLALWGEAQ